MNDELSLRIDDLDETVCELISHVEALGGSRNTDERQARPAFRDVLSLF
jgi:hypothetical protein